MTYDEYQKIDSLIDRLEAIETGLRQCATRAKGAITKATGMDLDAQEGEIRKVIAELSGRPPIKMSGQPEFFG